MGGYVDYCSKVIIVIFKSEFDEWVAMWIISKKWL
jgi:hypothetical protein